MDGIDDVDRRRRPEAFYRLRLAAGYLASSGVLRNKMMHVRVGIASGRHDQIAADDNQHRERQDYAENRSCNRGQLMGIQPLLQRSAHRSLIRS